MSGRTRRLTAGVVTSAALLVGTGGLATPAQASVPSFHDWLVHAQIAWMQFLCLLQHVHC